MVLAQFVALSSVVQPGFWHALSDLKINDYRLSDDPVHISASYSVGRALTDRESGSVVDLGATLAVGDHALESDIRAQPGTVVVRGMLKNFNTLEEFRSADKTALFNEHAEMMWNSITESRSSAELTSFLLLSFADLKHYRYYYWFAFPAFVAKPPWQISHAWSSAADHFSPDTASL